MTNEPFSSPTGLVLSAGGERVVAWQVGVLAGLADAGLDARRATRIVGTSAGALVAARLAGGCDPRADADGLAEAHTRTADVPRVVATAAALARMVAAWQAGGELADRRRRVGAAALAANHAGRGDAEAGVAQVARELPPGPWPPTLRLVAVDARSGARVVLAPADRVPLERAVAASRAVPMLFAPVTIDGRACMDGAVGSATNADIAAAAGTARIVVLDPNGGDSPLDRLWADALRAEVAALERRGIAVDVIAADAAARAAMGPQVMSAAGAPRAVAAGRATGRAWAGAWRDAPVAA
jgi:NTE family protein